ncbi:unnamed protein product, partial [Ilex paraguariensis]
MAQHSYPVTQHSYLVTLLQRLIVNPFSLSQPILLTTQRLGSASHSSVMAQHSGDQHNVLSGDQHSSAQ